MRTAALALLLAVTAAGVRADGGEGDAGPARIGDSLRRFRTPPVSAPEARDGEALRIGLLLRPDDPFREERLRGARLAVLLANERGDTGGPPVDLVTSEATGRWSSAAEGARDLVYRNGCSALVTSPHRDDAHLVEQVAARAHVPLITLSAAPSVTQVPVPWALRIVPDLEDEVDALVGSLPGVRRLGALVPDGKAGRDLEADLRAWARGAGIEIDPVLRFSAGGGLSDEGRDRLRPGPVLVWLKPGDAEEALAAAGGAAVGGPALLPRETFDRVRELGGLPGVECRGVPLLDREGDDTNTRDFVRAYRRAWRGEPGEAAATTFDAVALLGASMRAVGDGPGRIRDRLADGDGYTGVTGRVRFDGAGNRVPATAEAAASEGHQGPRVARLEALREEKSHLGIYDHEGGEGGGSKR